MSTDRCPVDVIDECGWSWHKCERPVKRNGKCGIHAAADERKAKTRAKVKADEEESRRNGETALAACGRLAGVGIDAVAEYGARGYTGGVIVAANSLPVLMSLFGGDAA